VLESKLAQRVPDVLVCREVGEAADRVVRKGRVGRDDRVGRVDRGEVVDDQGREEDCRARQGAGSSALVADVDQRVARRDALGCFGRSEGRTTRRTERATVEEPLAAAAATAPAEDAHRDAAAESAERGQAGDAPGDKDVSRSRHERAVVGERGEEGVGRRR